jgi:cation transport regulator ChaC
MLCYHIIEPSNVLCAQERIWGIAYKIPEHEVNDVMGQLDRRERCGYHTVQQMFYPEDKTKEPYSVTVYMATADNPWYLGPASLDQMAAEIATRSGPKGHNSEYLFRLAETVRVLMPRQKDDHLFELEDRVKELLALQA